MKWGYVIALAVIVALVFSSATVRNAVFGGGESAPTEETVAGDKSGKDDAGEGDAGASGAAGRLGEAEAASGLSSEVAR